MILRELKVHNIRSHREATVTFPEGTTLLAGDIGSGKTSLLLAIEMALFGFTEVEANHLVRHGAESASVEVTFNDEGHAVSLRRSFRRKTTGGRSTYASDEGSLARDGSRTRHSPSELKQWAIELLGFPDNPNPRAHSDLWRWAVYVPQEQMRSILEARPDDRLQTVRKALGVENYRQAAENARDVGRTLRQRSQVMIERAEGYERAVGDRAALAAEEAPLRAGLALAVSKEASLQADLAHLTARLDEAQALRRDLSEASQHRTEAQAAWEASGREAEGAQRRLAIARATTQNLEREHRELSEQSARASTALPDLAALEGAHLTTIAAQRTAAAANAAFSEAREREAQLRSRADEVARRSSRAREDLARRTKAVEALRREAMATPPATTGARPVTKVQAEIATVSRELSKERESLGIARHEETDLGALLETGWCPRCHQSVDAGTFGGHLKEAVHHREELERHVKDHELRLQALEKERESRLSWERDRERWEMTTRQTAVAEGELGAARTALETFLVEERTVAADLDQASARMHELAGAPAASRSAEVAEEGARKALEEGRRRHQEVAHLVEKLESLRRRVEDGRLQVSTLEGEEANLRRAVADLEIRHRERKADEERITLALRPYEPLEEQRRTLEASVRDQLRTRVTLEKDLEGWERRRQESDRNAEAARSARADAAGLQGLAEWMQTSFVEVAETLETRALLRSQAEFDAEFRKIFQTLVDDEDLRAGVDATFTPHVVMTGVTTPPEALSGGERTALALAFRLALGSTVRRAQRLRLDTLILDEPTDGFSSEQVSKLSDLVRELDRRQIVIVSHEAALEGIADHVVRLEKIDGVSRLVEREASRKAPGRAGSVPLAEEAPQT